MIRHLQRIFLSVCLLFCHGPSAVAAERWSTLAQPEFRHVAPDNWQSSAQSIAQDRQGFIWIGTQNGLLRWDGYRYRAYHSVENDPKSLPDDRIFRLHTDSRGQLWIGTLGGGLVRYDNEHDNFIRVPSEHDAGGARVKWMTEDGSGGLLVVINKTAEQVAPDGSVQTTLRTGERGLTGRSMQVILRDRDGRLWVATGDGLFVESAPGKNFVPVPLPDRILGTVFIRSMAEGSDGKIWVGTVNSGAFVIDPGTHQVRTISDATSELDDVIVNDFLETRPGKMWIATLSRGIVEVDAASLEVRRLQHQDNMPGSVVSDTVNAMFRDRNGLIWVGTDDGVDNVDINSPALLVGGGAVRPNGPAKAKIDTVGEAADGSILLSLPNDTIYLVNPDTTRVAPLPKFPGSSYPQTITYAFSNQIGKAIYAATQKGLYRVELPNGKTTRVAIPDSTSCRIVIKDGDALLAGCANGLFQVRPVENGSETISRPPGSETIKGDIRSIVREKNGALWLGTPDYGLYRYDPATASVRHADELPGDGVHATVNPIEDLLIDSHNRLWVNTQYAQIELLADMDTAGAYSFQKVGNSLSFARMLPDDDGNVWISTDDGVVRIDGNTLSVQSLGRGDGVPISEPYLEGGAKTTHGELLYCGKRGLTILRPQLYRARDVTPPVVVTDLKIGGKPLPSSDLNVEPGKTPAAIEVSPDANSVTVEFAALDYGAPERNRYEYRLDGYDKTWLEADTGTRLASYTNLPPGRFKLLLRGSNHQGKWAEKELALPLQVLPTWYQTWWAHVAAFLMAFIAIVALVQVRTRTLRQRRDALAQVVETRTAELKEKNSELARLNELQAERQSELTRFLAVASHDLRQPMHALNLYVSAMAGMEMSRQAAAVLGNVQRCARIMDDMFLALLDLSRLDAQVIKPTAESFPIARLLAATELEFAPQAKAKGVRLRSAPCSAWINSDPALVAQILGNLTANAVRYTKSGAILIGCRRKGARLRVAVFDTGVGIPLDKQKTVFEEFFQLDNAAHDRTQGLGLGLAIVKRLARLLSAPITLVSVPGRGSMFAVDLPLTSSEPLDPSRRPGGVVRSGDQLNGKLIVAVDDEEGIQDAMRLLLGQWGCTVVAAASARSAIDTLKANGQVPDVLITDDRLSADENGLAVIAAMRQEFGPQLPALIVTGTVTPERVQTISQEEIPVLHKPVDPVELHAALLQLTQK